ncbi:MAG: sigma-70 family RNA polymerase sigma factor [Burkholderiales bacterium]|nr:sigma-70 family RNA polymerase sigma factor [Burkholderiales bacterium]
MIQAQEVEALLARVAMGDRPAFKALYDLTAGLLLATATRVLNDRALAEDVVQDVFAGLWHQAADLRAPTLRNLGWLCVVTRNRAIDHARKRPADVSLQGQTDDGQDYTHDAPSDSPDVFAQLVMAQDHQCLQACLQRLAPEPRQAILLSYMEGLTHLELAQRMQRPLGTIKAWTRRSLMALKQCMAAAT